MSQARKKEEYLTKEALNRAAREGFREASEQAMKTAGSVVTVRDGWLMREFPDGSVLEIHRLKKASKAKIKKFALD